jgi:hypothetical protein
MIRKISAKSSRWIGHDHSAHRTDPVGLEKHMLGATKPDALGAETTRRARIGCGLGIGADPHAADRIRPAHQGREITRELRLDCRHFPNHDLTGRPIDGDDLARPHQCGVRRHRARRVIDADFPCARDAGSPHTAGDHRGMAGHAAAGRQDAPGGVHAVNVLRARLDADQDHRLAAHSKRLRFVGREHHFARGGPG